MKRLAPLLVLSLVACSDPVDKAAKKRIFSAEDPPQAVAAASEKLPPEEAADTVRIARRILGMSAAEATERIGPHRYAATVSWEWSGNGKTVRLKESRELLAGPGGVSGDFSARLSNVNEQGLEVLRVGGQVFARTTYGSSGAGRFRQRLRDRGMAERIRKETFGALEDFDGMFRGRLKLESKGSSTVDGRTTWKYLVSLGPPLADPGPKLPPPPAAKGGPDDTTLRRLRFYELRQPRTLQGEVFVDAKSSVVVRAKLDGRIAVNADGGDAELRLVLDSTMSDIGKAPALAVPADFLPDEDKPLGIAAALERFGIQRKAADAGTRVVEEPQDEGE